MNDSHKQPPGVHLRVPAGATVEQPAEPAQSGSAVLPGEYGVEKLIEFLGAIGGSSAMQAIRDCWVYDSDSSTFHMTGPFFKFALNKLPDVPTIPADERYQVSHFFWLRVTPNHRARLLQGGPLVQSDHIISGDAYGLLLSIGLDPLAELRGDSLGPDTQRMTEEGKLLLAEYMVERLVGR